MGMTTKTAVGGALKKGLATGVSRGLIAAAALLSLHVYNVWTAAPAIGSLTWR